VRLLKSVTAVGAVCFLGCHFATAGDPLGVAEVIGGISANWPDASFSIEVAGPSNGQALVGRPIEIEYEASLPGYLTYLRVSSHGDMTLVRDSDSVSKANGMVQYPVEEPLGNEQVLVLFSNSPLNALFSDFGSSKAVGSNRDSAAAIVNRLEQLKGQNIKFAVRRYRYEVTTPAGGTEYTTRGLAFTVLGGATSATAPDSQSLKCSSSHWVTDRNKGTAVPAHIEFEFDSDQLTPQGKRDLDVWGTVLNTEPRNSRVVLQGNTDAVGTDEYNMRLSARRAEATKQYLQQYFAVAPSRLDTVGMGKENPIMPNDNDANRACNRRVDFIISTPPLPDTRH